MPKKKKTIWIFVLTFVGTGAFASVFFIFPHFLKKQWMVEVRYCETNNQPRVISIYQEIGNSEDDGDYLTGYWLYLFDPTTNKELDKIFIKRSEGNVPQSPETYFYDHEIWLVGRPGFVSGEKTFVSIVEIQNDKFKTASLDFLNGWTVQNLQDNQITLINQYSEMGCLDRKTRRISAELCGPTVEDSVVSLPSGFFFVKNTPTSTRCHLYYYTTTTTYPPPGIFAGSVPADGTIPGWHLMDAVNMSYGSIDESLVKAYEAKFDTCEHLVHIQKDQLFNAPRVICSNQSTCTLSSMNDDAKTCILYQFNTNGKLIWKLPCPKIKSNSSVMNLYGQYIGNTTILTHPQNWVICIDNTNGQIKWQCPK